MTPLISVILPTIRPHLLPRAFASIAPAASQVSYEVVVVADFRPGDQQAEWPHLKWLWRERHGVIDAVNLGVEHSTGAYLFVFNDESVLAPGALDALYDAAQVEGAALLTPKHLPPFNFVYYGLPFAPFPFVRRDVATKLGGLFDPLFKAFYADPDLSLRAHAQGVPVKTVEGAILHHDNRHDPPHYASVASYLEHDRQTFLLRWAHLGELCDP